MALHRMLLSGRRVFQIAGRGKGGNPFTSDDGKICWVRKLFYLVVGIIGGVNFDHSNLFQS